LSELQGLEGGAGKEEDAGNDTERQRRRGGDGDLNAAMANDWSFPAR
jgi:hypothetical protein